MDKVESDILSKDKCINDMEMIENILLNINNISNEEGKEICKEVYNILIGYKNVYYINQDIIDEYEELEQIILSDANYIEIKEKEKKFVELLKNYLSSNIFECNVCHNDVVFLPLDKVLPIVRTNRDKYGFTYCDAIFQLENKTKFMCPRCNALDRDRLMIAFMDKVCTEKNERLKMLQVAPLINIEKWALEKDYIDYESTDLFMENVTFNADLQDMNMVKDETYDIIVCSHVLEHVKDTAKAMSELYRILKPQGVCLLLVPLIVGLEETDEEWGLSEEENWRRFGQGDHCRLFAKSDFISRLEKAGFTVNELKKEWFGSEFYQKHGFDEYSILYAGTKKIVL